jgi:hypothetical protein
MNESGAMLQIFLATPFSGFAKKNIKKLLEAKRHSRIFFLHLFIVNELV